MDSKWTNLDRLAARARQEITPSGDVRAAIRLRMRAGDEPSLLRPLEFFAAGYAAAGIIAATVGILLFNTINDPLSLMFQFGTIISP